VGYVQRIGEALSRFTLRYVPDSFIFAILLTLVVYAMGLVFTDRGPYQLVLDWYGGFWNLLAFGMQMTLILVTGYALANTAVVRRGLQRLADWPQSPRQAVALVAFVTGALGLINYGLSLVAGALLALEVGRSCARRGIKVHFPLLVAAGYIGLMIWHGGLSGSAPLTVNKESDLRAFLGGRSDLLAGPIPLDHTILSPMNLIITGGLLIIAPLVMALLSPPPSECEPASKFTPVDSPADARSAPSEHDERGRFPRLLEDTPIINIALAALIGVWAWRFYLPSGAGASSGVTQLSLDSVNMTMLMLGLLLHGTPRSFIHAVDDAARGAAGIIIQFPLYAGIMGVMHDSGLTETLAGSISDVSRERTLATLTFLIAAIIKLFVPSGGGQWAVQGPIALQAAKDAGVDPAKLVMAVAYGDQVTNMLQPFWALPLLAITGARARDIVGYTALLMLVGMVWIGVWLLIW